MWASELSSYYRFSLVGTWAENWDLNRTDMIRLVLLVFILLVSFGCNSVQKQDWVSHAEAVHASAPEASKYPKLGSSYSLGVLDGFAVTFLTSGSIQGITYVFDRNGNVKRVERITCIGLGMAGDKAELTPQ